MFRGLAEGERKVVTVLVVDTVGSTALAEKMDPEEWTNIAFGAVQLMSEAVHRFGGTVAQFTGDGIIAFFGAPTAHEDDALRAAQAGLALQASITAYAQRLIASQRVDEFQVRVGLNSGMVVVGDVGNTQFTEYLAIGDTVTVAQQVQSGARPGDVTLSDETARQVRSAFELENAGSLKLQGRERPIRLWRVGQVKARVEATHGIEGLNAPLIGRSQELALLRERIDALASRRGALISLIGEPGVGKSRLIAELRQYARIQFPQMHWFEARGLAYSGGIYSLFQQLLRASLGVQESDPVESIRQRLRLAATRQNFQDPELLTHMLELMLAIDERAEPSHSRFANLSGETLQRELFAAVRNTKIVLAQNRPVVFVLEDMQWADAASIELTLHDADLVRDLPLVIIAAFRPDRDAPSARYRQECRARFADLYVELELEPLARDETQALLDALLPTLELPSSLRAMILDKAEGNPFFVEEVLNGLIETRQLIRTNEHWQVARELNQVAIPNSLGALLTSRIDRLSEPTRRILQAASVIGRTFTFPILDGVVARAGWTDLGDAVGLQLGVLQRQQLIVERRREPAPDYSFKHALTQDAAYNTLLRKRRRELHRRVVETLEALYADRLDEHAAQLFYHARAGEDWQRAFEYARRAGENAARVYAREEAVMQLQRALDAFEQIPPVVRDEEQRTLVRQELQEYISTG